MTSFIIFLIFVNENEKKNRIERVFLVFIILMIVSIEIKLSLIVILYMNLLLMNSFRSSKNAVRNVIY